MEEGFLGDFDFPTSAGTNIFEPPPLAPIASDREIAMVFIPLNRRLFFALPLFFAITLIFIPGQLQARELIPTPPGGGEGISTLAQDQDIPFTQPSSDNWIEERDDAILKSFRQFMNEDKTNRMDEIGGDDNFITSFAAISDCDLAIAKNGDIFIAVEYYNPATNYQVRVYRSNDGGDNFLLWGSLSDPSTVEYFKNPVIIVAEGNVDRCYLIFSRASAASDDEIHMVHAALTDTYALFSAEITVMAQAGVDFDRPDVASDAVSFAEYYLYIVAEGNEGLGSDIYYSRTLNYGTTFESPYILAFLAFSDRAYRYPQISWGYGGNVHVAWYFEVFDHSYDAGIRYRSCPSNGSGGIGNWGTTVTLTPNTNGMDEQRPRIAASPDDSNVMLGYDRREWYEEGGYFIGRASGTVMSEDSGSTWGTHTILPSGFSRPLDMMYQSSTGDFIMGGMHYLDVAVVRANSSDPTNWTTAARFADESYFNGFIFKHGFALDESNDQQVGVGFSQTNPSKAADDLIFDAEWRAGPGYPNFEDGFPIDLSAIARSSPAMVDLDGNGDLEILFTDYDNYIQAYDHDGTTHSGWPVYCGTTLSHGPVAIGDLNGDGIMTVVVGTANGWVHAYDPDGNMQPGFPAQTRTSSPVFVSIGALGGPYPRTIVTAGGERLDYFNYLGEWPLNILGWTLYGQTITHPAAIGDVNGDGISNVVVAGNTRVIAVDLYELTALWSIDLPTTITDAVTLGDLDLDGDVEVAVPTIDGTLYVLDDDGTDYPNFPVSSSMADPMTSVAWAQNFGTFEPELVFATQDYTVETFYHTGLSSPYYPQNTSTGWWLFGAPILGDVDTFPADAIIGSRDAKIWSWSNTGLSTPGWPKEISGQIQLSPAMGDIDLDGSSEIAFLSGTQLIVVDVNATPLVGRNKWHMYGHDPQRTGCHNCPEDLLSPVEQPQDGEAVITRMSFAAPAPNPTSGPTLFSFELPVRAQVRLDVYDVRGHRVRAVFKEEVPEGSHTLNWDGRDDSGQSLASGLYFAQLKVRGPGLNQEMSRKVNLLR